MGIGKERGKNGTRRVMLAAQERGKWVQGGSWVFWAEEEIGEHVGSWVLGRKGTKCVALRGCVLVRQMGPKAEQGWGQEHVEVPHENRSRD